MAEHDETESTPSDADAVPGPDSVEQVPTGPDPDTDPESAPAKREPATVGARSGSSARPRGGVVTTSAKGAPTARRDSAPVRERRTTPPQFVRQSVGELRKVVYPTGAQLGNYFVVVLVFVLFIIAFVSLIDLGLGQVVFKVFS